MPITQNRSDAKQRFEALKLLEGALEKVGEGKVRYKGDHRGSKHLTKDDGEHKTQPDRPAVDLSGVDVDDLVDAVTQEILAYFSDGTSGVKLREPEARWIARGGIERALRLASVYLRR